MGVILNVTELIKLLQAVDNKDLPIWGISLPGCGEPWEVRAVVVYEDKVIIDVC